MLADLAGALRTAAPADFWLWVGGGCAYLLWAARTAFVALTYRRLIQDTPTTRLRAAAQGFVEVSGTARLFEGEPVLAPLTNRPFGGRLRRAFPQDRMAKAGEIFTLPKRLPRHYENLDMSRGWICEQKY